MGLEENRTGSLEYFGDKGHVCARKTLFRPVILKMCSAEPQECQGFRKTKLRNCWQVLLTVLNLYVGIKIRVTTFGTNHSVADSTAHRQSLIQSRNVLILQSSHSAQLAIDRDDVSGETVRLSIGLRLAVDFVLVMYIKDNKIAAIQSSRYHFSRILTHVYKP